MTKRITTFFFLLLTISLFSKPLVLPESLNNEDFILDKKTWNIGLSTYTGINLDPRYDYLLNALPLLIQEEISRLSEHVLSEKEIIHLAENFINEKIITLNKEKSAIHGQRDALLFSELEKNEIQIKYDDYSQKIKKKEELIKFWKDVDLDEIKVETELPVYIEKYSDRDSSLLTPRVQIHRFMETENLDFLIRGTVESLDDLFYLNIEGFIQHDPEPFFSVNKIVSEKDIYTTMNEAALTLRTVVLGRSWSELQVTASPDNAIILIDGATRGVGSLQIKDLKPGFITLSVQSSAYKSDIRQLYLPSGASENIEINLEKGEVQTFSLLSDPPGADVYFGASWIGKTPLLTEKPVNQTRIRIVQDNYMPFYVDSDSIKGNSLTVQLGSNLLDRQKELKLSKNKFYRSLGWFSLSVALPLISSGVYQNLNNRYYNYALDYNSGGDPADYDKAVEYRTKSDLAYYSLWGGVAVSGTLLVNTLLKLKDYIRAAEKSTED